MRWCSSKSVISSLKSFVAVFTLLTASQYSVVVGSDTLLRTNALQTHVSSPQDHVESTIALESNVQEQNQDNTKHYSESLRPRRKREQPPSWRSLQGTWGKRQEGSWDDEIEDSSTIDPMEFSKDLVNEQPKRAGWSSLQGAWGKRADVDFDKRPDENFDKRAGWTNMQGAWGKRADVDFDKRPDEIFDKRAGWTNLQGAWGKRSDELEEEAGDPQSPDGQQSTSRGVAYLNHLAAVLRQQSAAEQGHSNITASPIESYDTSGNSMYNPMKRQQYVSSGWLKRPDGRFLMSPRSVNWSSLRGSWGKRGGGSGSWSTLRGSWGKRGDNANWSNLRGAWGKRGEDNNNWSHLRGGWGKRGEDNNWSHLRGSWGKRGEKNNWSHLRGSWGKRGENNNWSHLRGSWGKRDQDLNKYKDDLDLPEDGSTRQ